jgi:hypothetical protein
MPTRLNLASASLLLLATAVLATLLATGPRAEASPGPALHLREVQIELVYPANPEAGSLTLTLFADANASDEELAAGRAEMVARFPGAVEVAPGEVAAQYRLDNVRWVDTTISWLYNPYEATNRISADAAFNAITASASGWRNAGSSGIAFQFADYTGTPPGCDGRLGAIPKDGQNVVGWGDVVGGYWGFTCWWRLGKVPGTSFDALTEFDIVFDPDPAIPYTVSTLRALALHEFGHALGLAHTQESKCPGVVMCAGSGAAVQQALAADDIEAIVVLYGAAPAPTPTRTPAVTPTATPPLFGGGTAKHRSFAPALARD